MNIIRRGMAAVVLVLATLAMAGTASATSHGSVCYDNETFIEAEYTKTTIIAEEVTETRHQLAKFTQERTQESIAGWQRYSFVKPGGWEADTPPPGPSEKPQWWQVNVAGDPHGRGEAGPYFVSRGSSGNGDWFYLELTQTPGPWSDWSEPVLWEPLSHEDWVLEGDIPEPDWQPHGSDSGWERQWALLPTGETRTTVVTPAVTETATEWFESDPGDPWVATGQTREGTRQVEVPCPDAPPTTVPEPIECPTGDGHIVGVDPYSYDECPPFHETPEPTAPPAQESTPPIAPAPATPGDAAQTLPVTGGEATLAKVGAGMVAVGLMAYGATRMAGA